MQTIPTNTTAYLTVTFLDKDGNLAAPSSARWCVVDVQSGDKRYGWVDITPIASVVTLTIPTLANSLANFNNATEIRRVVVEGTYGMFDMVTGYYDYVLEQVYREPVP